MPSKCTLISEVVRYNKILREIFGNSVEQLFHEDLLNIPQRELQNILQEEKIRVLGTGIVSHKQGYGAKSW